MKHQDQKQPGEERMDFTHSSTEEFIINSSEGKNLEAGFDAVAMEEGCLLDCSPFLDQAAFL